MIKNVVLGTVLMLTPFAASPVALASEADGVSAAAPVSPSDSTLSPGEVLGVDQVVRSPDGRYTFVQQSDGNLVLYNPQRKGIYSTNTARSPGAQTVMQPDGNLVIYAANHQPVFNSNTANHPGAVLDVQNDGNVVIYAPNRVPLWQTATTGR